MWHGTVIFTELLDAGRWKVESFSAGGDALSEVSEFPEVALGELFVESRVSLDPQAQPADTFTYIGMENVESGSGELTGELTCTGRSIKSRSKVVRGGQILYGRLRPTLNKVHLFAGSSHTAICSGEFLVLDVNQERIRPRVLREILSSRLVRESVVRFIGGAALPRVSLTDLASIKVPLPPLHAQQALEAQLMETDARRQQARQTLALLPAQVDAMVDNCLGLKAPAKQI